MAKLTWTNETRKLSQLIPWPRNPRFIKEAQVKRLQESREEFGQPEPILIGPDNELYNGHQRLKSWMVKFGDIDVDVRVSNRPLTEKEREKLTVYLHKGATGEFDFDILANEFELDDLLAWGFEPFELGLGADIETDYEPTESDSKGRTDYVFSVPSEESGSIDNALALAKENGAKDTNDAFIMIVNQWTDSN
jgi:hypothetical protein